MTGLRWGVLGTGGIARKQIADLQGAGMTVAAVGSRSTESAERFAREVGVARHHGSYAALVDDPGIDIVYVATPATAHLDNALLALEAGKHVLLEKPFTVTAAEAETLIAAARGHGRVLMEAMWTRFLPHMTRIHEVIGAGAVGEVRTLLSDVGQRLSADPTFRLNRRDLAGGSLLDIGVYPVAFAVDLFGAPADIRATSTLSDRGVDTQSVVALRFGGGQHAVGHSALDVRGPNRATILGTMGRIEIDTTWYAPAGVTVYGEDDGVIERFENRVAPRGMQFQAAEMERLVREGLTESPRMPLDHSLEVMRILDEVRAQVGLDFDA